MNDFKLTGKIAVITGASRGIGEAVAMKLAEYGAHCILVSRKTETLEVVAEKIRSKGGKASAMACHTGYPDRIEGLFKDIEKKYDKVDILINNAATNPHFGEMIEADGGIWDKTLDVNVKGPFFMMKYAVPMMKKGGAIVNVSSINGLKPGLFQGVYSVTKAALISMTQVMARELAPRGIRVNALLPGLTDTKFAQTIIATDEIRDHAVAQIPLGRYADPSEMAGAVLFLVSGASSFTTGANLVCDGGMII